jgi:hypothetical protein
VVNRYRVGYAHWPDVIGWHQAEKVLHRTVESPVRSENLTAAMFGNMSRCDLNRVNSDEQTCFRILDIILILLVCLSSRDLAPPKEKAPLGVWRIAYANPRS